MIRISGLNREESKASCGSLSTHPARSPSPTPEVMYGRKRIFSPPWPSTPASDCRYTTIPCPIAAVLRYGLSFPHLPFCQVTDETGHIDPVPRVCRHPYPKARAKHRVSCMYVQINWGIVRATRPSTGIRVSCGVHGCNVSNLTKTGTSDPLVCNPHNAWGDQSRREGNPSIAVSFPSLGAFRIPI